MGFRSSSTSPSAAKSGRIDPGGTGIAERSRSVNVSWKTAVARAVSRSCDCLRIYRRCSSWEETIVSSVAEDQTPGRRVHDPKHPSADADGYVTYSNVNSVEEMVNMISASRSYQNNIEVMNTAKSLLQKTLQLGQS